MQARALVKERAQRNLLLVIDGAKTEEMLLANLAGISAADFAELHSLGLIAPVAGPSGKSAGGARAAAAAAAAAEPAELDYAQVPGALTQIGICQRPLSPRAASKVKRCCLRVTVV